MSTLSTLINLERRTKQVLQGVYDAGASGLAYALAYALDLTPSVATPALYAGLLLASFVIVPLCFLLAGVYRAVIRYMAGALGLRVLAACALSALIVTTVVASTTDFKSWRFCVDYCLLLLVFVALPRILIRWIVERVTLDNKPNAVIYGAGAAGRQLLNSVRATGDMQVFAFLDDDERLVGSTIMGVPVYSSDRPNAVVKRYSANVVLLAAPSAGLERRKAIVARLERLSLKVMSVPGLSDILSGKAGVSDLQDVAIEDILGREAVKPDPQLISKDIAAKTVLITGAGGSIGSELSKQVLLQRPNQIILLDTSEYSLYAVDATLRKLAVIQGWSGPIVSVLASVLDRTRITAILERYNVDTVYHAAAYKHVPLVEHNPTRAISNNVIGSCNVASAAVESGVESFTLISTDKAVRPTNVMGVSKRLAELSIQAFAKQVEGDPCKTRFSIVRFGNVLDSSGSVVPKFRQQIRDGGPVTVTHQDIIRYFMTIPEAAQLVIQAGAMANGGEVFVLDMGEPVKIASLAERMIHLSGLRVKNHEADGDIEIVFSGLRPGEKLYEELLVSGEELPTSHERICRTVEPGLEPKEWALLLDKLEKVIKKSDLSELYSLLLAAPVHWTPHSDALHDVGVGL